MNSHSPKPMCVAAIGDSVTSGSYISSDAGMFFRKWCAGKKSWFSEVVGKINEQTNVRAYNFASGGAHTIGPTFSVWFDKLVNIQSMRQQIDRLLRLPDFPDVVLVWMGHNDLNWRENKEKNLKKITAKFGEDFQRQLAQVCARAQETNHKAVIVVFGFINIRVLFQLREIIAVARKQNPKLFPYFEKGHKMFPSIRPEYKAQTIELADNMNIEIKNAVVICQDKYQSDKFRVIYSDELSKLTTNSLENMNPVDGWHPSESGQKHLATAAWPVVQKQLEFLV